MKREKIITELRTALIYCKSSRRAGQLSLCKLQIKEEIQPRIKKVLRILSKKSGFGL